MRRLSLSLRGERTQRGEGWRSWLWMKRFEVEVEAEKCGRGESSMFDRNQSPVLQCCKSIWFNLPGSGTIITAHLQKTAWKQHVLFLCIWATRNRNFSRTKAAEGSNASADELMFRGNALLPSRRRNNNYKSVPGGDGLSELCPRNTRGWVSRVFMTR